MPVLKLKRVQLLLIIGIVLVIGLSVVVFLLPQNSASPLDNVLDSQPDQNTPIIPPENVFHVKFQEKREVLRDFDQFVKIKQIEKIRVNYQKKKDQSVVTSKLHREKLIKTIYPGLKFLLISTKQGNINLEVY